MWESLTIQSLIFFLFFQPRLLMLRRVRHVLLAFCLILSVFMWRYMSMDPFAWLLLAVSILLTYWTANKALRWVFSNKEFVQRELCRLAEESQGVRDGVRQKDLDITSTQDEIQRVSEIYENMKEMSGALELLDLFVALTKSVVANFPLNKMRLILLKDGSDKHKVVDKVYQADPSRSEFNLAGKSLANKGAMFQGQVVPSDLLVIETLRQKPDSIYVQDFRSDGTPAEPLSASSECMLIALPLTVNKQLDSVLIIEGVRRRDATAISILTDRFFSEFKRIRLYEDVQRLATTDWLTGLYVRRYFFKRLEDEISRCKRFNLKFSFLMVDIDDFKGYNDKYGHLVGDALLKQTAALIRQSVREVDLVARYGGEEFAAILLDTDAEGAMFVGQRIRKSIEKQPFKVYDEELLLTVSIGLVTYTPVIGDGSEVVEWADSALYQAKRQGKNRVCVFVN